MATVDDIIDEVQQVADASGDNELRLSLGNPGGGPLVIRGRTRQLGAAYAEPGFLHSVLSGVAEVIDDRTVGGESPIIWKWNETDLTQFGAAIVGGQSTNFAVRADGPTQVEAGLEMSGTWAGGGATTWPITGGVLPASRRCRITMDYTQETGNNLSAIGVFFHNNDPGDFWGFGVGAFGASSLRTWRAEGGSNSGVLPYIFGTTVSGPGGWPHATNPPRMGATLEFDLRMKAASVGNPPVPVIGVRAVYSRSTGADLFGVRIPPFDGLTSPNSSTAPVVGWHNRAITHVGLAIRSANAGAYNHEIQNFYISKHPRDM